MTLGIPWNNYAAHIDRPKRVFRNGGAQKAPGLVRPVQPASLRRIRGAHRRRSGSRLGDLQALFRREQQRQRRQTYLWRGLDSKIVVCV